MSSEPTPQPIQLGLRYVDRGGVLVEQVYDLITGREVVGAMNLFEITFFDRGRYRRHQFCQVGCLAGQPHDFAVLVPMAGEPELVEVFADEG
ncbi:MAG: hypothetical protein AAGI68_16270 [Planctomycetota bacterium]